MGFRITTNMMMNSYRYNLQGSTKQLSDARDMVLTQRKFNSYAEDPAAATQEFRLRRTLYQTSSQLTNTKNTYSKYNTAWNNLTEIKNQLLDKTAIQSAIRGDNGGTGEARRALAITLRETAESLIHALNQKLGDQFIFAGNDGINVPFEWKGGNLYYRGINVNSGGLVKKPTAVEPGWLSQLKTDAEGLMEKGAEPTSEAPDWLARFKADAENLIENGTDDEKAEGKLALEWYRYYTHATDVEPEGDQGNAALRLNQYAAPPLTGDEQAWYDYYLHTYDDETAEGKLALKWYNYYTHKTNTPPETEPDGIAEERLNQYVDAAKQGDDLTPEEQAWYDYYLHKTNEPPVAFESNWINDFVEDKGIDVSKGDNKLWYDYLSGASSVAPENGTRPSWVSDLLKAGEDKEYLNNDTDGNKKAWLEFYRDKDNYMKLKEMGSEVLYMDLGMGLAENSPNHPVNGSYFNAALCGIAFTGFGVDEDGDSLNLSVLMKELADVFQAWDERYDPQGYNPELAGPSAQGLSSRELEEKAFRLLDKLQAARDKFTEEWVELDAKSVFLTSNQERLETLFVDTETQILDVSQVDMAEAITNFSWQQYCYNAALRIGNQLLSQSLIDYMG